MATQQSEKVKKPTDEAIERIRELNEQIVQTSRQWGLGYLDAYEQSMRAFADLQDRAAADVGDAEWVSQIVKAQADFTREITKVTAQSARRLLK